MNKIKNSEDLVAVDLAEWNDLNDAAICYNNDGYILDDQDWSDFMKENEAKFIGANDYYYFYETSDVIIAIPVVSYDEECEDEDDCDICLDIENAKNIRKWDAFKLKDCSVDIKDNFFGIVEESLEEHNLTSIEDALNFDEEDCLNPLYFGIYDAIEACVYNAMRDIITYHSNNCFENNDMDNAFLSFIEEFEKDIDDMHNHELIYADSPIFAYKDKSGKNFLSIRMSKIAGVVKSIDIDLDAFESEEAESKLQVQLDNLTKEIIQESPCGLMSRLYIKK